MNLTKSITAPKANVTTPYGVFNKPFAVGALYILTMERIPKCACGCGQPVKRAQKGNKWNIYISGHNSIGVPKGTTWSLTKKTKQKHREYMLSLGERHPSKRPEVKLKIRKAHLGMLASKETRKKMSDSHIANPVSFWKDKHFSKEHKDKIKNTVHITYENPEIRKKCAHPQIISEDHKKVVKQFMLDAWQNPSFREKLIGENANNWRGGTTFEPYGLEFNRQLKLRIRKRDNYTCQNPNCRIPGKKLDVHHIDYDKQNNTEINLITLCCKCHSITNFERDYWVLFYQSIIKQKYGKIKVS